MMLLPKEHGAYGQMAFPLITSFIVTGITLPSLLLGVSVVSGFLAHEPLLVLLGRRGPRPKAEHRDSARVGLAAAVATAAASGILALWWSPPEIRWGFGLPLVPAMFLLAAISTRREKSWAGELAVATAFALVAVPTCLAAGAHISTAATVAVTFALVFVMGTLAVRVVILRVRGGGNPSAVVATRWTALALTVLATVTLYVAARRDLLPWTSLLAPAPALLIASAIAVLPPPPRRLRSVGWTLVAATTATAAVLIMAL